MEESKLHNATDAMLNSVKSNQITQECRSKAAALWSPAER